MNMKDDAERYCPNSAQMKDTKMEIEWVIQWPLNSDRRHMEDLFSYSGTNVDLFTRRGLQSASYGPATDGVYSNCR